ncbi:B-cell receptor CD22 isoform X1 [Fundulus heteroclitus]|uniref:B-cell receptor CD22 isoform X1 n=1 Tax=Fundulus heteroclitus TaxID=8078 RepID=UPI00165B188A|nr:B-cell receptor CD22 isoform X1 [Fundulus heteroclitus]
MTMNTLLVQWVIFQSLTNCFCYYTDIRFTLINSTLTAVEGSCIEMKCSSNQISHRREGAYWFWMKNPKWDDGHYSGIVIFSTKESERSVDPQFKNRVKYINSPNSDNEFSPTQICEILICDLRKEDTGQYKFRFISGNHKWMTNPTNLTVQENPCLITFSQPPAVMENEKVTLTCSTLTSCHSNPHIYPLKPLSSPESPNSHTVSSKNESTKSTNLSFTASREDDGRVFSCQPPGNKDKYLIRNITLTVEYAPKDVQAVMSHEPVKEGDTVNITCSAKGHPNVTFIWFINNRTMAGAQLRFVSIKASDSGSYHCQAHNKHGTKRSNTLRVDVLYPPTVHVQDQTQPRENLKVTEGDKITLKCIVDRSNPTPRLTWNKDGKKVLQSQDYIISRVKPQDSGIYTCTAINSVGSGTSNPVYIDVLYKPQSKVSISAKDNNVKVNSFLTFTCDTKANPEPWFSWYHYKQSDPSNWTSLINKKLLTFKSIQRTDEGCYICNASNKIGNGETSHPKCIQIIFPPTKVSLSLASKVKEGQSVTVICTAESFPLSNFELKRSSTPDFSTSEQFFYQPANQQNSLTYTFNVTTAHAGFYTCVASNSEGNMRSAQRKLEVEYSPKDVKIEAFPGLVVKEKEMFTLNCSAHSNPPISQFKWTTESNNKKEITVSTERTYKVYSSRPSDSGTYSCEVQNEIGSGKSKVEIKIKYAPKQTTIFKGEEQQHHGGRRSVKLSCSSHCYPSAQYFWYSKPDNRKVSDQQSLTVYSHQAGEYYCIAKNEMGQTQSDSVWLFDDTVEKILKGFGWFCLLVLVIVLIGYCRNRMNKANQQRTTNTRPCCSSMLIIQSIHRWCKRSERRNTRNENILRQQTSRSRDELLSEPQCRTTAQDQPPRPDVTSTTYHANTVYATVNVPFDKSASAQSPSAQRAGQRQQTCMEDDSLNYASLHFENKKKVEEPVYSQVCNQNPYKQGTRGDYENISMVLPIVAQSQSQTFNDDSETSDEEEVNYSQVNVISKPSCQTDTTDSSTSEDETLYSEVRL